MHVLLIDYLLVCKRYETLKLESMETAIYVLPHTFLTHMPTKSNNMQVKTDSLGNVQIFLRHVPEWQCELFPQDVYSRRQTTML